MLVSVLTVGNKMLVSVLTWISCHRTIPFLFLVVTIGSFGCTCYLLVGKGFFWRWCYESFHEM